MRRRWILPLTLALTAAACGGNPLRDAEAAMATKNIPAAEDALNAVLKAHPDFKAGHMERFVLYRYQAVQGDTAVQDAYRKKSLDEYTWLVQAYQLTEDYGNMESSMNSKPAAAADFAASHQALYGN